jgi:subtilisin family serine protease
MKKTQIKIWQIFFCIIIFFTLINPTKAETTPLNKITNDEFYSEQWYLDKIGIENFWKITTGSAKITIAVIDSGVDIEHPDLKDNIWINEDEIVDGIDNDRNGFVDDLNGWDFIRNSNDPRPTVDSDNFTIESVNHGTIISGIISAKGNNDIGIAGINWHSKIMPLRVLDSAGQGSINNVIKAINYAINNGAQIINLSFSGKLDDPRLKEIIKQANQKNVIIVTAAGNEGFNNLDTQFLAFENDFAGGVKLAIGNVDNDKQFEIIVAPQENSPSYVKIFNHKGILEEIFLAFPLNFMGGINIATGDIDGDKIDEIIVGAGYKGGPQVRVFDNKGKLKMQFFAFDKKFRGGVNVATGDVDGDGRKEIITGTGYTGSPQVKVFDKNGKLYSQFLAYDKSFRGGVNVSAGDIDGDGVEEIIAGAGKTGIPEVRIFDDQGKVLNKFLAYDKKFRGGVNVATGDIDGNEVDEIIAGTGSAGGPQVRIFDEQGKLVTQYFADDEKFRGGINIASGKIFSDSSSQIITGAGKGGVPYVRIKILSKNKIGINLNKFPLYPSCYDLPNLIGTTSVDVNDKISSFANFGDDCIKVVAPGEFYYGLKSNLIDPDNKYGGYWSGTSLATPVITGIISLIKSYNKDLTVSDIDNILKINSETKKDYSNKILYGKININNIISYLKKLNH